MSHSAKSNIKIFEMNIKFNELNKIIILIFIYIYIYTMNIQGWFYSQMSRGHEVTTGWNILMSHYESWVLVIVHINVG
jgi:hypothetical protein